MSSFIVNVTQPVEICICLPFCKVKARTEVYTIWCGFIQTHFSIPLLNRLPLIEYRALKTKNTEKKGVRKGWENSEDNFKSHCCYGNHLLLNGGLPSCLCLHHHVRTWTQQGDHSKTEDRSQWRPTDLLSRTSSSAGSMRISCNAREN